MKVDYATGIRGASQEVNVMFGSAGFNIQAYKADGDFKTLCRVRGTTRNSMIVFATSLLGTFTPLELAADDGLAKLIRIVEEARRQVEEAAKAAVQSSLSR